MKPIVKKIYFALPFAVIAGLSANCLAGSIELSPVRVTLADTAKIAVVTVRNTGSEESVMQVTLNKWTNAGSEFAYVQSQELAVTPATFRLPPGGQQIVRIGLVSQAPVLTEASYRLVVEEVPKPPAKDVIGTQLIVRHDMPVFVSPSKATKPELDISAVCAVSGTKLRIVNTGNVHAQVTRIAITNNASSPELGQREVSEYLLPKTERDWSLADIAPAVAKKNFHVTAFTDHGSFTADVTNKCS
jgi:fimbrial chaperone protein